MQVALSRLANLECKCSKRETLIEQFAKCKNNFFANFYQSQFEFHQVLIFKAPTAQGVACGAAFCPQFCLFKYNFKHLNLKGIVSRDEYFFDGSINQNSTF